MDINHVQTKDGRQLMDLREDTVTPETLAQGQTAHDKTGKPITGTMVQGGGTSVQADWDMTDSKNPAYIKNKPYMEFSSDSDVNLTFVPKTTLTFTVGADGSVTAGLAIPDLDVTTGGQYAQYPYYVCVKIDDVPYYTQVYAIFYGGDTIVYLGRLPLSYFEFCPINKNEPFGWAHNTMILHDMPSGTHTVEIYMTAIPTVCKTFKPEQIPGLWELSARMTRIDAAINNLPTYHTGTAAPASTLGTDGDVYLQKAGV